MKHIRLAFALALGLFSITAAPAEAAWAVALAYGHEPILARQYQFPSQAKKQAMNSCEANYGAGKCKIAGSGAGGCVALATTGKYWGFGKANGLKSAQNAAADSCKALNKGACRVVHSFCGR